jgi:hypothetical protein
LHDVLFVPGLARNLVSVNVLAQTFKIIFDNEGCFGTNNNGCTFFAPKINNLCEIPVVEINSFFDFDSSLFSCSHSCHCCTHTCDCPELASFKAASTVANYDSECDFNLNIGETSSVHLTFAPTDNTHDYAILTHANQNVSCFVAGDKEYKDYCESSKATSYIRGETHGVSTATEVGDAWSDASSVVDDYEPDDLAIDLGLPPGMFQAAADCTASTHLSMACPCFMGPGVAAKLYAVATGPQTAMTSLDLWHMRLNHVSKARIKKAVKEGAVQGLDFI